MAGWVAGLGGGTAGSGVSGVVLCGARGSRGAACAAGVGACALAGWGGGVCARDWAWADVRQASAFSSRLLEGLSQALEDIRVVLGCREAAGVDSLGVERIGQHGFPCGLWHPTPRWLEAAVLHRPLARPVDHALEGGLCPGQISQLPELRVGPGLPPLSLRGLGVGGVMGLWGLVAVAGRQESSWSCAVGVGSGGVGACGLPGTRARFPPRGLVGIRGDGVSEASAGCGLTSMVGRGAATLLVDPRTVLAWWGCPRGP